MGATRDVSSDGEKSKDKPVRRQGCVNLSLIAFSPKKSRADLLRQRKELELRQQAKEEERQRELSTARRKKLMEAKKRKAAEAKALVGRWLQRFKAPGSKVECFAKISAVSISTVGTITYVVQRRGDPNDEIELGIAPELLEELLTPLRFEPPLNERKDTPTALEGGRKRRGLYEGLSLTKCGECHHCENPAMKQRCLEFSRYLELFHTWLENGKAFTSGEGQTRGGRNADRTAVGDAGPSGRDDAEELDSISKKASKRTRGMQPPKETTADELEAMKKSYALLLTVSENQMDVIRKLTMQIDASARRPH